MCALTRRRAHHIHPTVAETLTVVRGRVGLGRPTKAKGFWDLVRRCASRQAAHGWRPVGDEEVRMLVEARPGARFEEMWRQFMGLLQDGKAGPKGPGFLQIMMMAHEFSDVCAVAGPPLFLQRAVAALVTPIGRLRGYKGRYEEYLTEDPP